MLLAVALIRLDSWSLYWDLRAPVTWKMGEVSGWFSPFPLLDAHTSRIKRQTCLTCSIGQSV